MTNMKQKWYDMRARCRTPTHPKYKHYGGRGITIDERWNDFSQFCEDMGEPPTSGHSLDRIDNDGPYGPENCKWSTRCEQVRNTRRCSIPADYNPMLALSAYIRYTGTPMNIPQRNPETGQTYRKELKPLPLRVAESQYARLTTLRNRTGISAQEHIRRAIDLYLAVTEKEAIELGLMEPPTPLRQVQRTQKR